MVRSKKVATASLRHATALFHWLNFLWQPPMLFKSPPYSHRSLSCTSKALALSYIASASFCCPWSASKSPSTDSIELYDGFAALRDALSPQYTIHSTFNAKYCHERRP